VRVHFSSCLFLFFTNWYTTVLLFFVNWFTTFSCSKMFLITASLFYVHGLFCSFFFLFFANQFMAFSRSS
jgi:hypothetical protein